MAKLYRRRRRWRHPHEDTGPLNHVLAGVVQVHGPVHIFWYEDGRPLPACLPVGSGNFYLGVWTQGSVVVVALALVGTLVVVVVVTSFLFGAADGCRPLPCPRRIPTDTADPYTRVSFPPPPPPPPPQHLIVLGWQHGTGSPPSSWRPSPPRTPPGGYAYPGSSAAPPKSANGVQAGIRDLGCWGH